MTNSLPEEYETLPEVPEKFITDEERSARNEDLQHIKDLSINEKIKEMQTMGKIMQNLRNMSGFGGQQGTGFGGDRNLYESCGWISKPSFNDFITWYQRGIGKTIIDIKPKATWNGLVRLVVPKDEDDESEEPHPLEEEWIQLWKKFRLGELFKRADKAAGIGQYSIMFLGFSDPSAAEPKNPVEGDNLELNSVKVFKQDTAEVEAINVDPTDENFGNVQKYKINNVVSDSSVNSTDINTGSITKGRTTSFVDAKGKTMSATGLTVDASRVTHIAEDLLENDVYGTPRLLAPLNYVQDYEKITGGSGEMFWRGALPGWIFAIDPESDYDENDATQKNEFECEVNKMLLTLKRYVRMQGITPHSLAPQVSDPRPHAEVQEKAISATTRIPNRLLFGSERGELSSSQDATNWADEINGRRETDCDRWIRDFVDKMMDHGVLTQADDYLIVWPEVNIQDVEKMSKVALNISNAYRAYIATPGAEQNFPFIMFLTEILKIPVEIARKIDKMRTADFVDEDNDLEDEDNDLSGA